MSSRAVKKAKPRKPRSFDYTPGVEVAMIDDDGRAYIYDAATLAEILRRSPRRCRALDAWLLRYADWAESRKETP